MIFIFNVGHGIAFLSETYELPLHFQFRRGLWSLESVTYLFRVKALTEFRNGLITVRA